MKNENWDRFLPKFKKENKPAKKKTVVKEKKWSRRRRVTRRYTPFPPENHITPSKVDLQIESGEYFLSEKQKAERAATKKRWGLWDASSVEWRPRSSRRRRRRSARSSLSLPRRRCEIPLFLVFSNTHLKTKIVERCCSRTDLERGWIPRDLRGSSTCDLPSPPVSAALKLSDKAYQSSELVVVRDHHQLEVLLLPPVLDDLYERIDQRHLVLLVQVGRWFIKR